MAANRLLPDMSNNVPSSMSAPPIDANQARVQASYWDYMANKAMANAQSEAARVGAQYDMIGKAIGALGSTVSSGLNSYYNANIEQQKIGLEKSRVESEIAKNNFAVQVQKDEWAMKLGQAKNMQALMRPLQLAITATNAGDFTMAETANTAFTDLALSEYGLDATGMAIVSDTTKGLAPLLQRFDLGKDPSGNPVNVGSRELMAFAMDSSNQMSPLALKLGLANPVVGPKLQLMLESKMGELTKQYEAFTAAGNIEEAERIHTSFLFPIQKAAVENWSVKNDPTGAKKMAWLSENYPDQTDPKEVADGETAYLNYVGRQLGYTRDVVPKSVVGMSGGPSVRRQVRDISNQLNSFTNIDPIVANAAMEKLLALRSSARDDKQRGIIDAAMAQPFSMDIVGYGPKQFSVNALSLIKTTRDPLAVGSSGVRTDVMKETLAGRPVSNTTAGVSVASLDADRTSLLDMARKKIEGDWFSGSWYSRLTEQGTRVIAGEADIRRLPGDPGPIGSPLSNKLDAFNTLERVGSAKIQVALADAQKTNNGVYLEEAEAELSRINQLLTDRGLKGQLTLAHYMTASQLKLFGVDSRSKALAADLFTTARERLLGGQGSSVTPQQQLPQQGQGQPAAGGLPGPRLSK